jgi:hypothetical protein
MSSTVGSRDELIADLSAAVAPGAPERLFVVFRIEGFDHFTRRYGDGPPDALISHVLRCLPPASGPFEFYYRPRKDELCGLVSGCLDGVEGGLFEAANAVYEILGRSGISLDFGTALLPEEASDPTAALALADGRMTGGPLARDLEVPASSPLVEDAGLLAF